MANVNQPPVSKAWTVVFAGAMINLALGVLYSWSVIAKDLVANHGWTKTQSAFPYTLACVLFAILMVPGGRFLDKIGPKWVAFVGAILVGAGMVLSSTSTSVGIITIGFGILVGAGIGLGYAAPTPAAVRWFKPHMKGTIAGLVVFGFGGASIYVAPLTNYLLKNVAIQKTFLYEGILFLIMIAGFSLLLSVPPAGFQPYGGEPPAPKDGKAPMKSRDFTPGEMVKTPQFFLLWLMFCFASSAGLMIIGHLATIAKVQGGIDLGFILVAILAVANAGGRIVFGILSDKIGRTNTMLIVFALQGANMFLFSTYTNMTTLIIGSVITGASYGSLLALFPTTVFDYYGMKNAGLNYALVFSAWGVAAMIGPVMGGRVADLSGGYGGAYLVSGILMVIAAVLTRFTKPPKVESVVGAGAAVKA